MVDITYRKNLMSSLLNYTKLIEDVIDGEISFSNFLLKYKSFYHYEALDGHEANDSQKQVLIELSYAIKLHEDIQCNILDKIYEGEIFDENQIIEERISPIEAFKRLKNIKIKYNLKSIIQALD